MKFSKEIFEKATIRSITEYLLFGLEPNKDTRDYETRLTDAYMKYKKAACQYLDIESSDLLNSVEDMKRDIARVYTEIGLQSGILLMRDMFQNIGLENQENSEEIDYQSMYNLLFKDITCALEIMQDSNEECVIIASEILKKGQCRCEEIYMRSDIDQKGKKYV